MEKMTQEELTELIIKNKESMYRLAYSIVGNDADAQDAVGETPYKKLTVAFLVLCILILGGTGAYAGNYLYHHLQINGKALPELDSLAIVHVDTGSLKMDSLGMYDMTFDSYETVQNVLGIHLLDSIWEKKGNNSEIKVAGDEDWLKITVHNYLVADAENVRWDDSIGNFRYQYETPVDLEVQLILTEEQAKKGLNEEYLGYYQYEESFVSKQGYQVNLLCTTGESSEDSSAKRTAVFVADGIEYKLTGKVSVESMKEMVDDMRY